MPPLVAVNAKYYGWRTAGYIAVVMYISMVATAIILHVGFGALGITPESARAIDEITRFKLDYTFWLNLVALGLTLGAAWGHRRFLTVEGMPDMMEMEGDGPVKKWAARLALVVVGTGGLLVMLSVIDGR